MKIWLIGNSLAFWRAIAIVLFVMCVVQLVALRDAVNKLESYSAEVNRLRNEVTAFQYRTNSFTNHVNLQSK